MTTATVIQPKWHTTAEVAAMLGFGLSKTKMLVLTGEIRSVKVGRNRKILPSWVDEYVERIASEAERWSA
ncbi:excisionase family DNA-binding protein [Streptomyces bambusae]|uniref:Excisionase family DNA-binding protein n=1 Tax=Streptomyces bambusae TaxID=1550616 RepID=A0ABS6Z7K5_9ACTN|nr:excisionase family DNA-binding protein [Streptomyces bambusae]MBW5483749.1 excisionase family DNA-binding protein [Streptomyces bambusae]